MALLLMGVMGHIAGDDAYAIVRHLLGGLPAGSYLVLQDGISMSGTFSEAQQGYDDTGAIPYRLRTPGQVAAFFDGLDPVDPGLVPLARWRPEPDPSGPPPELENFGGVAQKTAG